jgi:hypothetical protein
MSETALEAAARVGLLKADSTVIDRPATTHRIIEYLAQQPAVDLFGVETVAKSIQEITTEVFRSDDEDLRGLVSQLCSLRATGQVQHTLNGGGKMLCGKRSSIVLTLPGGSSVKHSVTQRFVSGDPDVVTQHLINQKLGSMARTAKETAKLMTLTAMRIPQLAAALEQRRMQSTLEVRALLMPETTA